MNNLISLIDKINDNNYKNSSKILKKIIKEYSEEENILIQIENINNINKKFLKNCNTKNVLNTHICIFCQNNFKKREHKIILPNCNHIFHKKCLNKYLKLQKLNFCCPLCQLSYNKDLINISYEKENCIFNDIEFNNISLNI